MPADTPTNLTSDTNPVDPPIVDLSDEIEIEEQAAAAVKPADLHRYKCRSCDYTYEPTKGDPQSSIAIGVPFEELPESWRCPVCNASQNLFEDVGAKGKASGFDENLGYGLGVNSMTPGQKNILIFGALGAAVALFMSMYLLQ
ncbi:MAG: rubredoxin [Synechococcus sp.]